MSSRERTEPETKPTHSSAAKAQAQAPKIGAMVLLRVGGTDDEPALRPALVVRVWTADSCNAQVFMDGHNDDRDYPCLQGELSRDPTGTRWCTSIVRGSDKGQWRDS